MNTNKKCIAILVAAIVLGIIVVASISLASALSVKTSSADTLEPGKEGTIILEVENTFSSDIEDVSLSINTAGLPFTPVGSSQKSIDKIDSDDEEDFRFDIKATNDITPGDYQIPYTLTYYLSNNTQRTSTGTIGISVVAQPDISFSVETENPIVGQKGKITLKIVNAGFSDARFVSVEAFPEGYTLLSESSVYIGSVDSDDFETASFDVVFDNLNADFSANVEYTDFNNKKVTKLVNLPVKVYTQEKAVELGLIKKSNAGTYVLVIVVIIVIWLVWRFISRRRRMKKSMQNQSKSIGG